MSRSNDKETTMSNAEHRAARELIACTYEKIGKSPEQLGLDPHHCEMVRQYVKSENDARKARGKKEILLSAGSDAAVFPRVERWIRTAGITRLTADYLKENFGDQDLLAVVTYPESGLKGLHPASRKNLASALGPYGLRLGMSVGEARRAYAEWLDSHAGDNGRESPARRVLESA